MEIVRIKISELYEDPLNLRMHGKENLEMIKKSLRESRQYKPLIVDEKTRIVKIGNGRLMAMKAMGWTECDCVLVDFDRHEGMEVIDNRLNELSAWQDDELDDWLINDKGVDWWGVDLKKSFELLKKDKKRRKAEEGGEDAPKDRPPKAVMVCPCCGKPVHKVKAALL